MSADTPEQIGLRQTVNAPLPQFFDTPGMDEVVGIAMALAGELWVVKERLAGLEHMIAATGALSPAQIEAFRPSGALQKTLQDERAQFLERVFTALKERAASATASAVPPGLQPPPVP
jgi:uncharacterized membrane protein